MRHFSCNQRIRFSLKSQNRDDRKITIAGTLCLGHNIDPCQVPRVGEEFVSVGQPDKRFVTCRQGDNRFI